MLRCILLRRHWTGLVAQAWEDLCRNRLPWLTGPLALSERGPWPHGERWWHGNAPEWDVVARSARGDSLLLGEARWSATPFRPRRLAKAIAEVMARPAPPFVSEKGEIQVLRALFVPALDPDTRALAASRNDIAVVTAVDLIGTPPAD